MLKAIIIGFGALLVSIHTASAERPTIERLVGDEPNHKFGYGGPGKDHFWVDKAFEDRIYGFIYFNINKATGKGFFKLKVTNGHGFRGRTVCMSMTFVGPDEEFMVFHKIGVDPRGENTKQEDFELRPAVWEAMQTIKLQWGFCPTGPVARTGYFIKRAFSGGGVPVLDPAKPNFSAARKQLCSSASGTGSVDVSHVSHISCLDAQNGVKNDLSSIDYCKRLGSNYRKNGDQPINTGSCFW